jgi:hypothetical protein
LVPNKKRKENQNKKGTRFKRCKLENYRCYSIVKRTKRGRTEKDSKKEES